METILALDVGEKRIGIAGSDPLGLTAQPLETLHRTRLGDDIAHVLSLARARDARTIVIGLPRNMDGSLGFQAEKTLEFARLLDESGSPPIRLLDERLTTKAARNVLIEGNVRREKRKNIVDRIAAVYILETYLSAPGQGRKLEELS